MGDWLGGGNGEWLWLGLGLVLATAELIVPGYFLIWLAVAAFITGMITAIADIGPILQLPTFAVFSVFSVLAARRWLAAYPVESADPLMNDRGGRLVGQSVTVTRAIEHGEGRVRHGDSEWPARGKDAPVGTPMIVIGHDGVVLLVEERPLPHIRDMKRQLP